MVSPEDIWKMIPTPALYEQLAEECVELAHAALKMARYIRKENPTPADFVDIVKAVDEEFTDVRLVAGVLGLTVDDNILQEKIERRNKRLEGITDAKMG